MTFATLGLAIAGVASIAIPIIIHLLFRQRRRPIDWAAMRFLLEAFRKQRRKLRLEQVLLLATRCLILLLLGFALARPLLQAAGVIQDADGRAVLLVVDNGLASSARLGVGAPDGPERASLADHIDRAREVVDALGPAESVGVITASRPAEPLVVPPSMEHGKVMDVLESIEPSEAPTDVSEALRAARETASRLRADGRTVVVYLFSDFRAGSASLEAPLPQLFPGDDAETVLLAAPPASETRSNVQVAAIEPVRRLILPGTTDGSQQVSVRLARHGGDLGRAFSRVRLQGDRIGAVEPKTVEWSPGQATATVSFSIDYERARGEEIGVTAVVEEPDAIPADNRRHLSIDVREKLRLALVSPPTFERIGLIEELRPGQWIRRALRTSETSPIEIVDVPPAGLSEVDLRGVDAAIVTRPDRLTTTGWRALRTFLSSGGLAVFTPPAELNVHPWTDRLREDLGLPWRIALEVENNDTGWAMADEQPESELLRLLQAELGELTRSVVSYRRLRVDEQATQATEVLLFADGSPMMIVSSPDLGTGAGEQGAAASQAPGLAAYIAVAPALGDWTSLPSSVFMVPLFQETVRQGLNQIRATQGATVGDRPAIVGLSRSARELHGSEGAIITLDDQQRPERPFEKSGVYDAVDASGRVVGRVAVNVDTEAGRTEVQTPASVAAWLEQSGPWRTFDPEEPAAQLATAETGLSIAGLLLIVLLALVIIETILARRFSHAYRRPAAGGAEGGIRSTVIPARAGSVA